MKTSEFANSEDPDKAAHNEHLLNSADIYFAWIKGYTKNMISVHTVSKHSPENLKCRQKNLHLQSLKIFCPSYIILRI